MYVKDRSTPSLDAYANQVLEVIDVISPDCDECEDNWRAITFLMNAQYQEEFDKTTISGHAVPSAAKSNDMGIFSSESINTQETTTSKRKRTWNLSTKALEEDSLDDPDIEDEIGLFLIGQAMMQAV